jgi:hypothetical protein
VPKGIVTVMQDLTGKRRPRIAFELTERELAAIGEIVVQWAYLEHQVLEMTDALGKVLGKPLADEARHFSFDRRLKYLTTLLKSPAFASKEGVQRYLQIVHRIHRLANDRQKIAHGLWDWDHHDPYTPIVSSTKPKHEFSEPFDFRKLVRLVERIAEINIELTFPDGASDENRPEIGMSRQAAAAFLGDAGLSPKIRSSGSCSVFVCHVGKL